MAAGGHRPAGRGAGFRPGHAGLPPSRQSLPSGPGTRCHGHANVSSLAAQLGQQRPEHARQDVPAAGRRHPGRGFGLAEDSPGTGAATRVVAPLSSTVAPVSPAARRAAASGASSTRLRPESAPYRASRAASSPACGVRTVCSGSSRGRAGRAPASATTGSPVAAASRTRCSCSCGVPSRPGPSSQAWTWVSAGRFRGCRPPPGRPAGPGRRPRAGPGSAPCRRRRPGRPGRPAPRRRDSAPSRRRRRGRRGSTCGSAVPGGAAAGTGLRLPAGAGPAPADGPRCRSESACTRPAKSAPGSASSPALAAPKVTVRSAAEHRGGGFAGVRVHPAGNIAGDHQARAGPPQVPGSGRPRVPAARPARPFPGRRQ